MGKLVDKLKPGMHMREVRKIIPVKPYLIIPENPMMQQVGETKWVYINSRGSLNIYFKDAIYTHHKIMPILKSIEEQFEQDKLTQDKLAQIRKQFKTWN